MDDVYSIVPFSIWNKCPEISKFVPDKSIFNEIETINYERERFIILFLDGHCTKQHFLSL